MAYARPKKNQTGLIIGLVIGAFALCCIGSVALIGGGGFLAFRAAMPIAECGINFEFAREAVMDYAEANKGKLPDADKWQDQIKPYLTKATEKMRKEMEGSPIKLTPLDPDGEWGCQAGSVTTGIAFNADLSGKNLKDIKNPDMTVLIFEVPKRGRNLAMPYKEPPREDRPKLFGEPRDWIKVPIRGESNFGSSGSRRGSIFGGSESPIEVETKAAPAPEKSGK